MYNFVFLGTVLSALLVGEPLTAALSLFMWFAWNDSKMPAFDEELV